ncbi:MAG: CRTAC1 family protein, partial [Abitibacteriaceae bacterium]|nr:CRTAC1 family protein [Abditibacteriaceae bacterium]
KQSDGGCGLHYFVEQNAAGAALFDANGDGNLDAYFPQPKPLGQCQAKAKAPLHQRLYFGDGKGHFRLVPNAFNSETDYGVGAAVGDYDNDGHPDLYVTCYGHNTLYHNRGDGTFEDVTKRAGVALGGMSSSATWFDYDGDGYLDLFVTRYNEWSVATDIACMRSGNRRDICPPTMYLPARDALFHNNGDGTFTDVTMQSGIGQEKRRGLGVAAADFNGDGKLDLFVANDMMPNFLFINKGHGKFEDMGMQENVAYGLSGAAQGNMGVAVGDYDENGSLDVLVSTFSDQPYTLYRNGGNFFTDVSGPTGIFKATLPYLSFGTGFLDARNLGRLDLFFANGHVMPYVSETRPLQTYKERNQLLLNDGHGKFTDDKAALPADDVRVHRGACFGDINNDGKIDILVTAEDDRPTLLRNDSTGTGHWLLLKLVDKHGCATPIGTKCIATIGGKKKLRVVLGGGSYAGESDHRVHFGLGAATQVERLEIHWLSGQVQVLQQVNADQILALHEP